MEEIVKKITEETRGNRYDVGDVWITRSEKTPTENGFAGTWERIKDTFILAAGDQYKLDAVGGEAEVTLTVGNMPRHSHEFKTRYGSSDGALAWEPHETLNEGVVQTAKEGVLVGYTGGSQPHNNMPPYRVFNVWLRTA